MPYDVDEDPYIDKRTGILRNLLDIKDQKELDAAEAELSAVQISTLFIEDKPSLKSFDGQLLCDIHQYLFGDIYDWAGQPRTIELSKDNTSFARAAYIEQNAHDIFTSLAAEKYLDNLDREIFVKQLAHYYAELNVLHPFREGNGRTIRTLLYMLAENLGYFIAWDEMDPKENVIVSAAAYNGDEAPLRAMLARIVEPIDP